MSNLAQYNIIQSAVCLVLKKTFFFLNHATIHACIHVHVKASHIVGLLHQRNRWPWFSLCGEFLWFWMWLRLCGGFCGFECVWNLFVGSCIFYKSKTVVVPINLLNCLYNNNSATSITRMSFIWHHNYPGITLVERVWSVLCGDVVITN